VIRAQGEGAGAASLRPLPEGDASSNQIDYEHDH
jgi:hypothetical protein